MASTIIGPLAQRLEQILAALDVTPTVTAYKWTPPRLTGTGPFGIVEIPRLTRTPLDQPEGEIGSNDWVVTFPVVLYVDLKDADRDQDRIVDLLEAFVNAIDANPTLRNPADVTDLNGDAQIMDVKVTAGDPTVDLIGEARPLLGYECEVQVLRHVPTTP